MTLPFLFFSKFEITIIIVVQYFYFCLFVLLQGYLVPGKSIFPSGIKALADYVDNKSLKLGIYSDAGQVYDL